MPRKACSVMSEKLRFLEEWLAGKTSRTELCAAYGISRKSAYALWASPPSASSADRRFSCSFSPSSSAPNLPRLAFRSLNRGCLPTNHRLRFRVVDDCGVRNRWWPLIPNHCWILH